MNFFDNHNFVLAKKICNSDREYCEGPIVSNCHHLGCRVFSKIFYKWNKGKTELIPLTPEEESKLDFRKRTKQYMDNIKTTDRIL